MIELIEGTFWVMPEQVVAVKSIGKNKCILWTAGQPSTEGHVLDYSAEEVVEAIEDCYNEDADDEGVESKDEQPNDPDQL